MSTIVFLHPLPGSFHLNPITPYPNPTRSLKRILTCHCTAREAPITLSATKPSVDLFRQLTISSIVLLGVGYSSYFAFSSPASARISDSSSAPLHSESNETGDVETVDNVENLEMALDEDTKARFESWKSKTYALTVPLRIVALNGSLPAVWIKEFLKSQGKRARLRPEYRQNLQKIFLELSNPFKKGKLDSKSAATADLVTIGDSWLNFAIDKGLIEPIEAAEYQDWFHDLSDRWKVYLRRSNEGKLDSQGRIWAVPYRWGSMVIMYNKKEFQKRQLAPIEDWSDLWRPELAGKISMIDSPREIVGAVLKAMGGSYNTTNIDTQVVGGKHAVHQQLESFIQQVRLFDTQHYLRAFRAGDVWVAIGWSSDVIPAAKLMSNIAVIVPKSGASLWADFWAIPSVSRLHTDKIGGRTRGPSPLVYQWVDFCLQPERSLPFKKEIIAGASPISLKTSIEEPQELHKSRPKLDTNLIANIPPADILARCEFLEPLSEDAIPDYQWLLSSLQKPDSDIFHRIKNAMSIMAMTFWPKTDSRKVK